MDGFGLSLEIDIFQCDGVREVGVLDEDSGLTVTE